MVFFEGQHFSVSVSFLSFGGYIFGVYSSMGKQLGLSDNTGNFEFFWRSDMVEKLRKVMEQYHSKVFALLCHCALFLGGPVLWPCLHRKMVSQTLIRQTSGASTDIRKPNNLACQQNKAVVL